jgi:aromatic-L-amino-acid/L-tryptophan decarboxylase
MSGPDWAAVIDAIESLGREIDSLPVSRPASPAVVRADVTRYGLDQPIPLPALIEDVTRLLRTWSVHVTQPRYFGLFNPSVRTASVVGDLLAAVYNPQLAVWSHAPAVQEVERLTLRSFTRALGMNPDDGLATFTTGGAEANLSAVLAALAHLFPDSGRLGVGTIEPRPALYVTNESHHSFVKVARMTGLGTDALREIPTTARFVMDTRALAEQLAADRRDGWRPLLIVGTAGTTATGAIDPLPELAGIARDHGAWFHVDAAWGGSAALSPRLRPALAGIESADSVTWDAHKWLSVPMGAGMFFCRHADAVRRAFAVAASYMPPAADVVVDGAALDRAAADPYNTTVQWSRRAIGLKVFLAVAELGLDGYADLIDSQARMGDVLRQRLGDAGWTVVNETPLPVVCFTHADIIGGLDTGDILKTIHARGRVWISDVAPGGGPRVLRACITSYRTGETDIDCLIEEIEHARRTAVSAARSITV